MLSQRNEQISQSLYDYYLADEDLDDSVDDEQPIDFSKRYSDLETDDGAKSSGKKRQLTTVSASSESTNCKQHCDDDLRVYCIEGTPLLISSSSSMCDLRDIIGVSDSGIHKKSNGSKFPLSGNSKSPMETFKEQNELQEEISEEVKAENITENNEGDNIQTFEIDEKSSKASSPLMFSRSSSVCSLNSFEQHSIVDDQSSVSIFSNLTSGLISPSDIPDSPGEAMSPFIQKNKQEFKFLTSDSEKESPLTDAKLNFDGNCNEAYDNVSEDDVKVYNIEGDCSSMSSFSELSIHTSSHMSITYDSDNSKDLLNIEQKTSLKISCSKVIDSPVEECSNIYIPSIKENSVNTQRFSNLDSKIVSNLFEGDMKNSSSICEERFSHFENEEGISQSKDLIILSNTEDQKNVDSEEDMSNEASNSLSQSDDETDALLEECIRNGRPSENSQQIEERSEQIMENIQTFNIETANESCNSSNESDDEVDMLLEECIKNGRPQESLSLPKKCNQTAIKIQECEERELPFKENYASLKPCIGLGKNSIPEKPKVVNTSDLQSSKIPRHRLMNNNSTCKLKQGPSHFSKQLDVTRSNISLQGKKCRSQPTPHTFYGMKPFRPLQHDRTTDPMKKLRKELLIGVYRTLNEEKSEKKPQPADSDSEDEELLINQCIKLGMPDKKLKKHSLASNHSNQNELQSFGSHDSLLSQSEPIGYSLQTSVSCNQSRLKHSLQSKENQMYTQSKRSHNSSPHASFHPKNHPARPNLNSYVQTVKQLPKGDSKNLLVKKEESYSLDEDLEDDESCLLQQYIQLGMPMKRNCEATKMKELKNAGVQCFDADLGYRDNCPDGASDDDDDDILLQCINAGKPKQTFRNKDSKPNYTSPNRNQCISNKSAPRVQYECMGSSSGLSGKQQSLPFSTSRKTWAPPFISDDYTMTAVEEWPCVYKTEDTPVLSPTASISDLSSLSFNEDKNGPRNHLNNSRNSDCSSDSDEDDELLLQCIQSGMPASERAVA